MQVRAAEPDRSESLQGDPGAVRPVVAEWLATLDLEGVDIVRAQLALALASEIDDDAAAYAVARLTTELRSVMAEITGRRSRT